MIVAGIDPGQHGAIVFLDSTRPEFLRGQDMPILHLARGGKSKNEIDAHTLARILKSVSIGHAFVEQVGAMPGQGVTSMFAFGRAYGIVIGILAALDIPTTFVPPRRWKTSLRVPAAKDGARARANELFPHLSNKWGRVKDDGRAEAALIALYGLRLWSAATATAE